MLDDPEHDSAKALADWLAVEAARLVEVKRGRQRYAPNEVVAFLDEMAGELGRGQLPDPSRIEAVQFHTIALRGGFEMRAVDDLLDLLRERVLVARGAAASTAAWADATDAANPDAEPAKMIIEIRCVRFARTRGRGYDFQEVDEYLNRVAEALMQGLRPEIAPPFSMHRHGYDPRQVDAFIARF